MSEPRVCQVCGVPLASAAPMHRLRLKAADTEKKPVPHPSARVDVISLGCQKCYDAYAPLIKERVAGDLQKHEVSRRLKEAVEEAVVKNRGGDLDFKAIHDEIQAQVAKEKSVQQIAASLGDGYLI